MSNHLEVRGLWQGTSIVNEPGRSPVSALRIADSTRAVTRSPAAAAQTSRYDTPGPTVVGSPPLASVNAFQALLTQTMTPFASSRAISTPTSPAGNRETADPAAAPSGACGTGGITAGAVAARADSAVPQTGTRRSRPHMARTRSTLSVLAISRSSMPLAMVRWNAQVRASPQ